MGFVPYGEPAEVTLAVVAYGVTPRLRACLDSLIAHRSAALFDVVCVLNPDERDSDPDPAHIPGGIHVLAPEANLGWAGGLHLVRHATRTEWMAWIQDDSEVREGWLDAHLSAARDRPRGGAFGAVAVSDDGRTTGLSGGTAVPGVVATEWNSTDPTVDGALPAEPERRDWVTSKGMLVRLAAWDDVGGTCGRYFPLNRVDKQFTTHLRSHGWEVYLVPDARVKHLQSQSAPGFLRQFIAGWQNDRFLELWDDAIRAMQDTEGPVEHPCHGHPDIATVERETLREASRILVPFGRYAAAAVTEAHTTHVHEAALKAHDDAVRAMQSTTSWRVTAPLRWVKRFPGDGTRTPSNARRRR